MKRLLIMVCYGLQMLHFSCSKSSTQTPIPPQQPQGNLNNEVKVMISYFGGSFSSYSATGSYTGFNRGIFYYSTFTTKDTVITISSAMPIGGLGIYLPNDITLGTYVFKSWGTPGNFALPPWCEIITGNGITSLNFYRTMGDSESGSITIEELTPNYVKGVFTATLHNTERSSEVITITAGSFKGDITNK